MGQSDVARARILVLSLAAWQGCVFDAAMPDEAKIRCDDGSCPEGLACLLATQLCVEPGAPCVEERDGLLRAAPDGSACARGEVSGICLDGGCQESRCGDGFFDLRSEGCDDGEDNSDVAANACRTSCTPAACGDVVVDLGEACDDGNTASGDGCRADCGKVEVCGDRIVDEGEACDDGDNNPVNACDACGTSTWTAEVVLGDGGMSLVSLAALAFDRSGALFGTTVRFDAVRRVDVEEGVITGYAGSGANGFNGDGLLALSSQLSSPGGIALDAAGNLFIADSINARVRRVDALTGVMTTIAGTGTVSYGGDGGLATAAQLRRPGDVAVAPDGSIFIADADTYRVRRVDPAGIITTVVGTGAWGSTGDGGDATLATVVPRRLALDATGTSLFIGEDRRVRRLDVASGTIHAFAGATTEGDDGDGGPAVEAHFRNIAQLAAAPDGALLVADDTSCRVRRVADGIITAFAGDGRCEADGDGGAATAAALRSPEAVAIARNGDVWIGDGVDGSLRRVSASNGVIETMLRVDTAVLPGDGGLGVGASLRTPSAVDVRGDTVLFSDRYNSAVRRLDLVGGRIDAVLGDGLYGTIEDGAPAAETRVGEIDGVLIAPDGALYVADPYEGIVARVDPTTSVVAIVAGDGSYGPSGGDGGPATVAQLYEPRGLALDQAGALFIAESAGCRVRRVDAVGIITTVVGTGSCGYGGDGGDATLARIDTPYGLHVTADGRLLIADVENHRVRQVEGGVITTLAGTGENEWSGDGGPATLAGIRRPHDIAEDADGNLFIAEVTAARVRRIDAQSGVITTVVGDGLVRLWGDNGPAASASLRRPLGVAVAADGALYIADGDNRRIRRVLGGRITSVAGEVFPGVGPFEIASVLDAKALAMAPSLGGLLIAGGSTGLLARVDEDASLLLPVAGASGSIAVGGTTPTPASELRALGEADGVAWDDVEGVAYVTDRSRHVVWRIANGAEPDATVSRFAGSEGNGGFEDADAAADARFQNPSGLAFDAVERALYVADAGNHVVRRIEIDSGVVTTVAGVPGIRGFFGENDPALEALFAEPEGVAIAPDGAIVVADTQNHRVRRVDPTSGAVSTLLGDGTASSGGAGSPARVFPVQGPRGLAFDSRGNLFVSSTTAIRVVVANDAGILDGENEVRSIYGAPPRDDYPMSVTRCLTGVAIADDDELYATDACTALLLRISRTTTSP